MKLAAAEWRVTRDDHDDGTSSFVICLRGKRGAMKECVFHTPRASNPQRLFRLKENAQVASAAVEMVAVLEDLHSSLAQGKPITIEPMTRRHMAILTALTKARGDRS